MMRVLGLILGLLLGAGCESGPPDCFDVENLDARVGPGTEPEISWDMGPVAELAVEEVGSGMNIWLVTGIRDDAENPNVIESPVVYGEEPPNSETERPARSLLEGVAYELFATVECNSGVGFGAERTAFVEFTP